jgi:hypothetical protein
MDLFVNYLIFSVLFLLLSFLLRETLPKVVIIIRYKTKKGASIEAPFFSSL